MTWLKQNWYLGIFIIVILFIPKPSQSYGDCSEYGFWATYDYLSGGCKCMSGYVFGKDILGNTTCVSGNSVCYDKYGYSSRYDSLTNSCECSYGYVFGKDSIGRTQCISENQACQNQYGYNSRSTYGGKCECSSGYEFTQKSYGSGLECQSCFSKYGIHSSYDYLGKQCGCDDGYTLKNGTCVEKQNNVYFTLKELDTDNKEAIIRSDYDLRYYFIKYNSGCYASSFRRYLNDKIVVNLGTDFDLDRWDKIVLQDDNETCDITYREKVDSSFTLEEPQENADVQVYFKNLFQTQTPAPQINDFKPIKTPPAPALDVKCNEGFTLSLNKKQCVKIPDHARVANDGKNVWLCDEGYLEKGNSCMASENTIISPSSTPTENKTRTWTKIFKFWKWF